MANKPDKKYVKSLIEYFKTVCTNLKNSYFSDEKAEIDAIRKSADALLQQRLVSELQSIDVDILSNSKQGIRVSYLKDAGIHNIYELSKLSVIKLESISGIGKQSASKIFQTTKEIVENTKNKLSVSINVDSPTQADDALMHALYTIIIHAPLRQKLKEMYEKDYRALGEKSRNISVATGALKWAFASKSKKALVENTIEELSLYKASIEKEDHPYRIYTQTVSVPQTEYRAHFRKNSATYYSILEQYVDYMDTSAKSDTGLSDDLLSSIENQEIDLKYMKATLRSYQTFGVKYAIHQKRTLLGDEMGLGKTIQAIASIAALKAQGKHHFMVVCPASVLINWVREIEKHSTLGVTKVHGGDEESLRHWRENGDVAVTTYESISRFELPEKFTFDMLVVDEAHYVKNPEAQRTVAMKKLLQKTEYVLYMSGTPLVNRVDEMCFLLSSLKPEISHTLEKLKSISTAEQFRQELAPIYLRRVREDVLKELPNLIEKEQWCVLNKKEEAIYKEAVLSSNLMAIRQVSWQVDNLDDCTKAQRLKEICEQAKEQGRKVIVFSFFRNTLNKVTTLLSDRCMEIISGDISPARRQEIVDEFNSAEPGAVLVSQVQAGGTGLNIQCASVVVFCEPQLTPAIENQAVSRAYRMGQTSDVLVYRLLADETIDERMLQMLSRKQKEFDSFADESVIGDQSLNLEDTSILTQMVKDEQKRFTEQ